MTRAPACLLESRALLLEYLDDQPLDDLDPAEAGIVPDDNHHGGYHCGSDRVDSDDYSVDESSRDRLGLTLDAAALDVGYFSVLAGGKAHTLRTFSIWCVAQCVAGAPDTRDIREIIYSPDGEVVLRWDRLKRRTTGDGSHRSHTHFSLHRDAIKAGRGLKPLFTRYLREIGLIDVDLTPQNLKDIGQATWAFKPADHGGETTAHAIVLNGQTATLARIEARLATMAGKDFTDEPAIIAGVLAGVKDPALLAQAFALAGWTPAEFAAALPTDFASAVVDELGRRTAPAE